MKFINTRSGVILEPASETVVEQLRKSPDYKPYDGQNGAQGGDKDKGKPLSRMNKEELLAAAQAVGVEVPEGATNAEIVDLIQANSGNQ